MRVRLFMVLLGLLGLLAFWGAGSVAAAPGSSVLLDCNGYGAANNPDHPAWRCPDVRGASVDEPRFEDNGHYIGHDEPSLLFYSSVPGSGNSMVYLMQLPKDPPTPPRQDGTGGTYNYQLYGAGPSLWLGMALCDDQSAPNPGGSTLAGPNTACMDSGVSGAGAGRGSNSFCKREPQTRQRSRINFILSPLATGRVLRLQCRSREKYRP